MEKDLKEEEDFNDQDYSPDDILVPLDTDLSKEYIQKDNPDGDGLFIDSNHDGKSAGKNPENAENVYVEIIRKECIAGNAEKFYIKEKERIVSILLKSDTTIIERNNAQRKLQMLENAYTIFSAGATGNATNANRKSYLVKNILIAVIIFIAAFALAKILLRTNHTPKPIPQNRSMSVHTN